MNLLSPRAALAWLGFADPDHENDRAHDHPHMHGDGERHGHTHGVVDPTIATSDRGIWAMKWSFVILAITAALQFAAVVVSGSVALLADTIHNIGDAVTAVPLWIAFSLARRKPSPRFTYGLGRVEDLAGVAVVAIILSSAIVAAWEAVDRLIHPRPITLLWAVAAAGAVGFLGNEACAIFRIRVGREIDSAALIADGYHARTDGLTSLAVVAGAVGVWLGFRLADPIVGLLITIAIFGVVWQSAKAVFTRVLDGVDPDVLDDIRHATGHVPEVSDVLDVRSRWVGHRLTAEVDVAVDGRTTVREAEAVSSKIEHELLEHLPALSTAHVRTRPFRGGVQESAAHRDHVHEHAGRHHDDHF
jgi:cation diffusion facilitator family transporter